MARPYHQMYYSDLHRSNVCKICGALARDADPLGCVGPAQPTVKPHVFDRCDPSVWSKCLVCGVEEPEAPENCPGVFARPVAVDEPFPRSSIRPPQRDVRAMTATIDSSGYEHLYVACTDGTFWTIPAGTLKGEWRQLPSLPRPT